MWLKENKWHLVRIILLILGVIIGINVLFSYVSPQELVKNIGVENSYLVTFLVAALGGVSSFTSPILYTMIATFAAGGSTPWLIGLSGGLGIALGDILIFILCRIGYLSTQKLHKHDAEKYLHLQEKLPLWSQYLLLYLILGFTPFPNDLMMLILVLLGYRLRAVAPLLLFSGITFAMLTAHTGEAFFSVEPYLLFRFL